MRGWFGCVYEYVLLGNCHEYTCVDAAACLCEYRAKFIALLIFDIPKGGFILPTPSSSAHAATRCAASQH